MRSQRIGKQRQPGSIQNVQAKKRKHRQMLSKGGIIAVLVLFICCLGILGQRLLITYLDQKVQALENEAEILRSENDAKQGQITESQNDTKIKATAKSYGMTEATAGQKIVETISPQSVDDEDLERSQWYHRLFE